MRALASDENHVVVAVDAQGQESSSTAVLETAMRLAQLRQRNEHGVDKG